MNPDTIVDIAKMACTEAKSSGADQAEVKIQYRVRRGVHIERSAIQRAETIEHSVVSVRAVKAGRLGCSVVGGTDRDMVLAAARDATAMASYSLPDPDFRTLPSPEDAEAAPETFDPKVAEVDTSQVVSWAMQAIDEVLSVKGPTQAVSGLSECGWMKTFLVNSLGLEAWLVERTNLHLHVRAVAKNSAEDVGSHEESTDACRIGDFRRDGLGRAAAEMAARQTGAVKVEAQEVPVVLGSLSTFYFLQGIARNAGGGRRRERNTYFLDKTGERVSSEILTLRDDGYLPWGLLSGNRDQEGSPRKRVTVIENGILKNWLHGNYTALYFDEPNTGHGTFRNQSAPSNIVVDPGRTPAADIIAEIPRGIYVVTGGLGANANGSVSSPVETGFLIEKGELTRPIKNTILAGNIFDILNDIDAISCDFREEPGRRMPTIRIRKMHVVG